MNFFIDSEMYIIKDISLIISKRYNMHYDYQTLREDLSKLKLTKIKKGKFNYYNGKDLNRIINNLVGYSKYVNSIQI
jgi:hypothetical protein